MLVFLGNLTPEEHAHLILVEATAEGGHNLFGYLTPTAVGVDVGLVMPFGIIMLQGFGGCELDAAEGSAVDVALDFQNPRDKGLVGAAHADTPSGHVVAF